MLFGSASDERPKVQEMLSFLESTATETSGEHMEKSKLELVQTIEREQEEHAVQKAIEVQLAIEEKDREFGLLMEEKEKECKTEKEKELAVVIADMKLEKEATLLQKKRENVDEITGMLEVAGGVVTGERGTGSGGVDELAVDDTGSSALAKTAESKGETRAVMIIGSNIPPPPPPPFGMFFQSLIRPQPTLPLAPANLSDEGRQVLTELGLPPDQWNNLNALLALYNKTENYDVFSVQVSKPGMELSRSYILEQIEFLLKNSMKKTEGAVLHYYGNSQRNTGDWCFQDGTITFRDIADLYMKHGRGRGLSVVSDCHSSGRWVSQCAEFLDEQGVKSCGHSAREKGILLKVYASCQTGQDSTELLYITRAMEPREDGHVYHYYGKELSAQQRTFGVDFTRVRCKKGEEEECSISPDATWSTAGEVSSHRKCTVRRQEQGHPAWHFVLLDDDAEKIKDFIDKRGVVDLKEYGKVLKLGSGKDPPSEDQAWFDKYGHP